VTAVIALIVVAYFGWRRLQSVNLPEGFTASNGRIEAVEIDVAAKTAGRLVDILANEGDFVTAGQVLARMDTESLNAQVREAEAELRRANAAIETARSVVTQRDSEKGAAEAIVLQREAEFDLASQNFSRAEGLLGKGALSKEQFDTFRAAFFGAKAAVGSAKANVAAANAAITTAKSQVIQAEASVGASQAKIDRLKSDIADSILKSPRDGRVQYRVAQPGEVLGPGGKVLNLIDLGDVYMTFFLPTASAGRVRIGAESRLVLDAAPQFVIPAHVSYVADVAQFTPKTVETAEEREKLMFRIKAQIDPSLLKKYIRSAKTGLPGIAYVRLDDRSEWPAHLQVRLPDENK
jgi:HlyD family secretion protein